MKRKLINALAIITIILSFSCTIVRATAEATFVSSKTEVKQGDSFTVTLSVSDTDGINGVVTEYSYDEGSLELQEAKIGQKLVSLGVGNKIEAICNSVDENSLDVVTLTFKVKDDAKIGEEVNINTKEVMISSFGESDSTKPAQNVKIKIIAKEEADKKDEYPTKEEDKKEEEDKKDENQTKEEDKKDDKEKENNAKEETKKDTIAPEKKEEQAPNKLPKTGIAKIIIYAIIGLGVIAVISYIMYKRYYNV